MLGRIKPLARRGLYPALNLASTWWHRRRHAWPLPPDLVLSSQRGNDYARHRRRVSALLGGLAGRSVLVFGCGSGKDLPSWLEHQPGQLVGTDLFAYPAHWQALQASHPHTSVDFLSGPEAAASLTPESFDLVASDAVLEHLKTPEAELQKIVRALKPGGLFYSTFGPLWYAYGGDHLSGWDSPANAYAHLVMSPDDYAAYVEAYRPVNAVERPEDDPRLWVREDLFSRLDLDEYATLLTQTLGLKPVFVAYILEPRFGKLQSEQPETVRAVLEKTGKSLRDLEVTGMTFIGRKTRAV